MLSSQADTATHPFNPIVRWLASISVHMNLVTVCIRAAWLPNVVSWILSWTNKDPDLEGSAGVDNVKLEAIGTFRQLEEIYRNVYTKDATAFSSKVCRYASSAVCVFRHVI